MGHLGATLMSYDVSKLEPRLVWKYFDLIRQIPRCSGHEDALAQAILSWAKAVGVTGERDAAGNVVVRISATAGFESAPGMVLQGHMDMVCEKHVDKVFDFRQDPIVLVRDGEWMTADATTLGADNGIGLATALAFMEVDDVNHGPIEVLATVEEETGLFGALALDSSRINGRMLFNFDSEEDGIFYVGCAGGRDTLINLPIDRQRPNGKKAYELTVNGLRGGHSGLDIVLNRGNGVVLLARVLRWLRDETPSLEIGEISGGDKHNAIPREARAIVVSEGPLETIWGTILKKANQVFEIEFGEFEPELAVRLQEADLPESTFSPTSTDRIIDLLLSIPNGVMAMMRDIPDVVETSNNLARVTTEATAVKLLCSSRSSINSETAEVAEKIEAICRLASAKYKELSSYPGWKPNMASSMLANAKRVWKAVHGSEPEVRVVHAGLECGIIGEKFDGMDMISIGPTIQNPHSPSERVHIPSVERFFEFAKAFIASVAEG